MVIIGVTIFVTAMVYCDKYNGHYRGDYICDCNGVYSYDYMDDTLLKLLQ